MELSWSESADIRISCFRSRCRIGSGAEAADVPAKKEIAFNSFEISAKLFFFFYWLTKSRPNRAQVCWIIFGSAHFSMGSGGGVPAMGCGLGLAPEEFVPRRRVPLLPFDVAPFTESGEFRWCMDFWPPGGGRPTLGRRSVHLRRMRQPRQFDWRFKKMMIWNYW